MRLPIVWIIFCKEITEALRDRVTLLVLVGLPLLIYPLAIFTTTSVANHQAAVEDRQVTTVAVWGVGATPLVDWLTLTNSRLRTERWLGMPDQLRTQLVAGRLQPPPPTRSPSLAAEARLGLGRLPSAPAAPTEDVVLAAARAVVSGKQTDAVLVIWPGFDDALQRHGLGEVSVYYDSVIPKSALAWSRLSHQLDRFRQHLLKVRQRERGLPEGFVRALDVREDDVAPAQRQISNLLGHVLPLMLIMLAVVGALVAAVDMTAGEKDRATMQTLLCAPVGSFEIVAGKFLAVWGISLLSATANIVGMGFTISRLAAAFHVDLIEVSTLVTALGLLLPATWTIAALFLAVAALARDVNDAGNFLGAAAFAVMLPVAATLLPGVELDVWTYCVPLVNLSLLIRTLMTGQAAGHLIFLTLLTSLAYAGLALALAARVFGREQILLLVTQYGVLFLPVVALATARKFPLVQTFSLRWPSWRSLLGSGLIGLSVSVALAGLALRLAPPPESMLRELQEALQLGDKPAALWKLWLMVALTPALCEETFFRGLMLSGLRRWGGWAAIGITALLFGLLHGSIYRLLPTFILGLVLGYAVWRSGSLYCSILIHGLNNGLIVTLIWSNGGKQMDIQSVPWSLTLGALAIMGIGLALLTRPKSMSP